MSAWAARAWRWLTGRLARGPDPTVERIARARKGVIAARRRLRRVPSGNFVADLTTGSYAPPHRQRKDGHG